MKEVWKHGKGSLMLDVVWLGCLAFSEATIHTEWIRLTMISIFLFAAALTFSTGFYAGRSSVFREQHEELLAEYEHLTEALVRATQGMSPRIGDVESVRVISPERLH